MFWLGITLLWVISGGFLFGAGVLIAFCLSPLRPESWSRESSTELQVLASAIKFKCLTHDLANSELVQSTGFNIVCYIKIPAISDDSHIWSLHLGGVPTGISYSYPKNFSPCQNLLYVHRAGACLLASWLISLSFNTCFKNLTTVT